MDWILIALFVILSLAAVPIGRWWALVLPFAVWPTYFVGVAQDWWEYALGNGWQTAAVTIIVLSLASFGIAVGVGDMVAARRRRPAVELDAVEGPRSLPFSRWR